MYFPDTLRTLYVYATARGIPTVSIMHGYQRQCSTIGFFQKYMQLGFLLNFMRGQPWATLSMPSVYRYMAPQVHTLLRQAQAYCYTRQRQPPRPSRARCNLDYLRIKYRIGLAVNNTEVAVVVVVVVVVGLHCSSSSTHLLNQLLKLLYTQYSLQYYVVVDFSRCVYRRQRSSRRD